MIISCFFAILLARRYADTQIGVPAMTSNQLPEVLVGFTDPPHSRRISKLSRKYWCDKHRLKQESMPIIPVNSNHPAASAARKQTPSVAVYESPPRAAKARANNALMHGASASAPHNVASVAAASVTTDAGNAAGVAAAHALSAAALDVTAGSVASPLCSVNSSLSSDSDIVVLPVAIVVLPVALLPLARCRG